MKKPLDILLIEDDIDDIDLLKDALNDTNVPYHMDIIMDGDKACSYLKTAKTLPGIIVMDLNLPKIDGREILHELRSSFYLTEIPVIILTTSSSKSDMDYCNKMGIKKFITKPASMEGWNNTSHVIMDVAHSLPN